MRKLTEAESAYVAGFLDGEGNVGSFVQKGNVAVRIQIVQKDERFLRDLSDLLGAGRVYPNGKGCFVLAINRSQDVSAFIEAILPHSRRKSDQLLLAAELAAATGRRGQRPSDVVRSRRMELHTQLRALTATA